ncbi:hypothetical protein I7X12_07445 [Halosimplex litoreum]|uniref:Uncharacterized protein n=1 Tax=Halosimplex litoreum TaxID=1198301 RepID=A0A7T3KWK4_9EURY|nr:hypothetical protein [Halosimplex litoreum]QPV64437.1 hypothetical protein I7X12_07445 [Halosimplex litoreum]
MSDSENVQVAEEEQVEPDDEREVDTSHLDGVEDGCGCAEVWEHLSDERDE